MAFYDWDPDFLARCAAKVTKAEQKFTTEQLEYLREYRTVNKYPLPYELQAIALQQWNIDDFDFYISMEDWVFGRNVAEVEIEERRHRDRITAA